MLNPTCGAMAERGVLNAGVRPSLATRERAVGQQSFRERLLRIPLLNKILIANAAIVFVVALVCGLAIASNAEWPAGNPPLTLPLVLAFAGVAASLVINAVVLRIALRPLDRLIETAELVNAGDHSARAPQLATADPQFARLVQTFNTMLDNVQTYRHRLRDVAVRALDAGESERKRISQELHDGVAQSLAAMLLQVRLARGLSDAQVRDNLLAEVAERIAAEIEGLRVIARELRPPALDMLGLSAAVEAYARDVMERSDIRVEVRTAEVNGRLRRESELALYRLIQEAISNVVRHADADTARIILEPAGNGVAACIEDDGKGFDVAAALNHGAPGLFGMYERAAYAGGTVQIHSQYGKGTRVRIEFPINETGENV